jgi:hypothetical protein
VTAPTPQPDAERVQGEVTAAVQPYLIEWATEVDDLGTKEIHDTEAEARAEAKHHGQRLFRIEWTEVEA